MTTNELALARAFRNVGIPQDKAEMLAEMIFDAIRDNVAAKGDIEALRSDLDEMRTATRYDLAIRLERLENRLKWRGLGALATGLTLLFAALHYWPPHP